MPAPDLHQQFKELVKTTPVVDVHNDLPYQLRWQLHYEINEDKFKFDEPLVSQTDLIRLRKGGVGLQFFSCWMDYPSADELYKDFETPNSIVRDTLEQVDIVKRLVDKYSKCMKFVTSADEALKSYIESDNKLISVTMGVEGLHQVDTSLAVVRQYFDLGVRYITLTHNCDNPFATACTTIIAGKEDKGLTLYGHECVKEFNRIGMMVDLSHVSHKTMVDVLKITKAPVIFSHSSAYTMTPHERNVRDDVLLMVKENGGVICINFVPNFIKKEGATGATIDDCVDHIVHIVNLIGWDHIAIGSDFDGMGATGPEGLEDVSKYPDLVVKVWEKTKASADDIKKFMGINMLRVWKECELVAEALKNELPVEATWSGRKWRFPRYITLCPELFPGAATSTSTPDMFYDAKRFNFKDDEVEYDPKRPGFEAK
ncbi:hypothetical protein OGAPHI_003183 [Ogataea philodendri]|uniref:Dipeptidase n=1 Tax=Ogataea philodendri TaxID=1378263 RepID=A0A9P8P8Q0_9ASCO|nr:uncharacterized protein OGAPHI_003183 [Ogataea philodendri]KAH3666734.1 hypothetical protein OGAPHI_003183 [Ogataea philodendri]